MSLINQMLKDLEDRKESAIKGQDGIISRPKIGTKSSRAPLLLLSLVSLILLTTVIYLLWQLESGLLEQQSVKVVQPAPTTPLPATTIASLVEERVTAAPEVRPVPTPATSQQATRAATPVIVAPRPVKRAVSPQPVSPQPVPPASPPAIRPLPMQMISISQLTPAELKGSWKRQPLIITGKNFTPDSQVLLCWPTRCVTLKEERISYTSPTELQISITTGIKQQRWTLTVLNPNGQASNATEFNIIPPASAKETTQPQAENNTPIANDNGLEGISKRIIPLTAYQQAEEYYLDARRLNGENKQGQAITLWERALLLAPEHHASRQALVEMLITSARVVEAEGLIQQAIKLFPSHPIYIQKLAQLHVAQGDNRGAITLIENSINRGVANAELYAYVAALYQREKSPEKSIAHYQRALTLKPDSGVWWMGLGISFEQDGQFNDALSAFQQAKNSGTLSYKLKKYVDKQIALNRKRVESD